jgi:hypothetical protein
MIMSWKYLMRTLCFMHMEMENVRKTCRDCCLRTISSQERIGLWIFIQHRLPNETYITALRLKCKQLPKCSCENLMDIRYNSNDDAFVGFIISFEIKNFARSFYFHWQTKYSGVRSKWKFLWLYFCTAMKFDDFLTYPEGWQLFMFGKNSLDSNRPERGIEQSHCSEASFVIESILLTAPFHYCKQ